LVDYPNLIVTRTFSKAFGLAGLRVGFAASSSSIQDVLNRVRQPFNVNLPALAAACAALKDQDHIQKTVTLNAEGMAFYEAAFKGRQLEYIPSVGNFITLNLGRPAAPVYDALLKQGIIVRPIANYGLPQHLRITIGTAAQNAQFLAALDRILYL
jgi:histidinol-phosphate aminotransferase